MEIGTIDNMIGYTVPRTLILTKNAFSTMKLHSDLGATGSQQPFWRFEDLKGPKLRLPWQQKLISQSLCEVSVVGMLISVCVRPAGRTKNGALSQDSVTLVCATVERVVMASFPISFAACIPHRQGVWPEQPINVTLFWACALNSVNVNIKQR